MRKLLMKKLLFIAALIIFSCSKDDSSSNNDDFFKNFWEKIRFVFPVFGRFGPFLAVFSTQDQKHRPPDPFFHLVGPIFIEIRWI